jgi:hypothetical protein
MCDGTNERLAVLTLLAIDLLDELGVPPERLHSDAVALVREFDHEPEEDAFEAARVGKRFKGVPPDVRRVLRLEDTV